MLQSTACASEAGTGWRRFPACVREHSRTAAGPTCPAKGRIEVSPEARELHTERPIGTCDCRRPLRQHQLGRAHARSARPGTGVGADRLH